MGALKKLDAENGEIKSMRVADAFLGRGAGRAMLDHILAEARAAGPEASVAGDRLDARVRSGAEALREPRASASAGRSADYTDDPFSRFMTLAL